LAFVCDIYREFLTAFATHQNDTTKAKTKINFKTTSKHTKSKPILWLTLLKKISSFKKGTNVNLREGARIL
jgi:hypothetical protein